MDDFIKKLLTHPKLNKIKYFICVWREKYYIKYNK